MSGNGAVEVVDGFVGDGIGQRLRQIVDDLHLAVGLVELDVLKFAGRAHTEERCVGFEIVVVKLPDEAGLCGIGHPGDDGGSGMEELGVAAFVHGAIGLVVHQLRLADEVGEVADLAVAVFELTFVFIAPLRALGEVVFGPIVGDGLPVFFGHHAVDGFERWDGEGAGFGLEVVVADDVELARRAPVVRAVGADAGA